MTATTATTATIEPAAAPAGAGTLRICCADDAAARAAWARFVEAHPERTVFHHPLWTSAVAAGFGHRSLSLMALRGGQVVGVLPLMLVRSVVAGRMAISVPYGSYGGPLVREEAARAPLVAEARRIAQGVRARVLELRMRAGLEPGFAQDDRYATFRRPLPASSAALETYLPRKARAAARQAVTREQLELDHDASQLGRVWELYARSMRRLGSLNYPRAFFDELAARLGANLWVTTARRGRTLIGGLVSFAFGDTLSPYFLGVDERARCTGATNALYLAVMQRGVEHGLRVFDFGRSRRDNCGACAFKRNQGFEPTALAYQRVHLARAAPIDLNPGNPRFAAARRIWPHLPLALTTRLGAWLSRSIPG